MNSMSRLISALVFAALLALAASAQAPDPQQAPAPQPQASPQQAERQKLPPPNNAPPRSRKGNDEESSSNDTKIDLSPPADDSKHPGANARSDVNEFHVYDPHKAEKDVEVGDFYFKRKNYPAAISRYRSALNWK